MATKHTHTVVFGRKIDGCPRCDELKNGAPVIKWSTYRKVDQERARIAEIRSHNCQLSKCGPVCTAFDW